MKRSRQRRAKTGDNTALVQTKHMLRGQQKQSQQRVRTAFFPCLLLRLWKGSLPVGRVGPDEIGFTARHVMQAQLNSCAHRNTLGCEEDLSHLPPVLGTVQQQALR